MKYHYEDGDIKISIRFPNKPSKLLANANVSLKLSRFGWYSTKGFQIWPSSRINSRLQQAVNIVPPSRRAFPSYIPITFFEDVRHWNEVERLIYSAFLEAKKEINKAPSKSEDIDPDEIPL